MGSVEVMTQKDRRTGRARERGKKRSNVSKKKKMTLDGPGYFGTTTEGNLGRTDSPPLHFRNTECEPIISSGLGLLGRYCWKEQSNKRLSAHTINRNPGEIDGNTTTMRARGAGGGQGLIRKDCVGFGEI